MWIIYVGVKDLYAKLRLPIKLQISKRVSNNKISLTMEGKKYGVKWRFSLPWDYE